MAVRYLEDFQPGDVHELGEVTVTEEHIIEFGERYDPQPFHVDPAAAKASAFGGLIASGWLTASLFMRQYVENLLVDSAGAGSPGIDELRYYRPVRPGDVLRARFTVLAVQPAFGRPDRGIVRPRCEMLDAEGKPVLSMILNSIFLRDPDRAQSPNPPTEKD